jgi:hypothetical protein
MNFLVTMLLICFGIVLGILAIIFLIVPLLRALGWMIGAIFSGIGWVLRHTFEFIGGMLTDTVRFVGSIIAWVVLLPAVLLNVIIGRWSAAGHFFRSMKRECGVAANCLYRVVLQRPLRFLLLGGLLEGLEERVNEAWEAAPTSDKPGRRAGSFDGYTIVGSLPGGGSGAKLYVAEPDEGRRIKDPRLPKLVVIKSFTLTDGSSLPQIVRESRALEAAKQLGLVVDHGMDEHRFFYVMPYHQGEHLGIITRQIHGQSDGQGLGRQQLAVVFGYARDLLGTLSRYHEGGLWHKDVKPDNIIVHDDRAHLVDLGLVTPLRSAMTLTTHGTEYFRDPEMVRMALRGVKVHQVDGAKFDIYAVGAVMYFVLENTFPAHGGLSSFAKRSPESARWIIRRAMADYNKRYETAGQMLADLQFVAAAADPFAVKPAELPSMRGAEAAPWQEPAGAEPQPAVVAAAGSPVPPKEPQPAAACCDDVKVEVAGWGVKVGSEGAEVGKLGQQPAVEVQRRRPKIRVTNWWTGAYEVVDPEGEPAGADQDAARAAARAMREQVRGFRAQTDAMRRKVHMGRMTARRAAREQIKQARARAKEMQRRARAHRHQAVRERQPSAMVGFLALVVLLAFSALALGLWRSNAARELSIREQVLAMGMAGVLDTDTDVRGPLSLLVINDHPAAGSARVQEKVDRLVYTTLNEGWDVIICDESEVEVRKHLPVGPIDPEDSNLLLRKTLEDIGVGGILRINTYPGKGQPHERMNAVMIALPAVPGDPLVKIKVPAEVFD